MRRYLMCRPTYFAVDYAINPWMDPTAPVDVDRALAQWTTLLETYRALGHTVDLIDPIPGLPDMVFAANGATVIDGKVLGLNAVSDGRRVVLPVQAVGLANQLRERGYEPVGVDLSELRKAGGGPKCCTLEVRA